MRLKQNLAVRLTAGLLLITTMAVPALAATGTVYTGGSTLRVRAQANTSCTVLTKLRDGTKVEVLEATNNGWYKITAGSITGYVSGDYLTVTETAPAAQTAAEEKPSQDILAKANAAESKAAETPAAETAATTESAARYCRVTTSSLNVRSGAGTGYSKVGSLRAGKVVEILGEVNGWYKISNGYISAEYTVAVSADEAANNTKGQEIADYALQFVGYRYVYGGASPKGFDCSGLTKYVYAQFGYNINRTASNQLDNGTPVSMSELQPGDLVMFKKKGTGSSRASHVGIYIGDGKFVHASSPEVGVIVSKMNSAYYTTGFVGGRRIV